MKRIVMLDKNEQVTTDPAQAVIIGETEYDDAGHLIEETFYFLREEVNGDTLSGSTIENFEPEILKPSKTTEEGGDSNDTGKANG